MGSLPPQAMFRSSNLLNFAVFVLATSVVTTFSCGRPTAQVEVSSGSERRDPGGLPYREHRIGGLRVVEAIVGGEAPFGAALPVVVQVHGRGDRVRTPSRNFAHLRSPVRLLLPEAPDAFADGFTWSPVSVTENRTPVLASALRTNADRIAAILDWVADARPVVGRPIVSGFSQGAMLAYTLAVRHPTKLGTAIPIAGWVPPQLLPRRMNSRLDLPLIDAIHGTDDPIVRVGPTRRSVRRLRQLGFDVDFEELSGVRHLWNEAVSEAFDDRIGDAVDRERGRLEISSDVGIP